MNSYTDIPVVTSLVSLFRVCLERRVWLESECLSM